MKKLEEKIIQSILKGITESLDINDLLNNDELTLDELNIANNLNPEYVNLGLPSGTLWCTHNVGANNPEEYGGYFTFNEANNTYVLPTKEQFLELVFQCKWIWKSNNKINGYKIIGKNHNYIFLPAAGKFIGAIYNVGTDGYYWSSSNHIRYNNSYLLHFFSVLIDPQDNDECSQKLLVRTVYNKKG